MYVAEALHRARIQNLPLVTVEADKALNRIAYLVDGFRHRTSAGLSIGKHAQVFARALDSFFILCPLRSPGPMASISPSVRELSICI